LSDLREELKTSSERRAAMKSASSCSVGAIASD
jgi:hypothetical protein